MAKVMVVDDSALQRRIAGDLLDSRGGHEVSFAANGREAMERMASALPDLVVTDLEMPEMDGLSLVEELRTRFPAIPVVLMTAYGGEEVVVKALERGAASYVPKKHLLRDLVPTVSEILAVARTAKRHRHLMEHLISLETSFLLDNDPLRIPEVVEFFQENIALLRFWDENQLVRVGVALTQALDNALYHGNLEIPTLLPPGVGARSELALERRKMKPYCDRRIAVTGRLSRAQVRFVVRDEGPGFDLASLPEPGALANVEETDGRGLQLMRRFMDEVTYNSKGNEVTLVKNRDAAAAGELLAE